jgi:hypothetical protein
VWPAPPGRKRRFGSYNFQQTAASRAEVEAFLKKTSAQFWIQHDLIANQKLKKSPGFYE